MKQTPGSRACPPTDSLYGMSRDVLILREPEIRSLLDPHACIEAMERAFTAYSTGQAQLPSVIQLDVPENHGEIHVKAGHVRGWPYYAVKIVSGFLDNPKLGLAANDGMVVVFDAKTGAPAAILLDNGFITDLRTAAAGAVAAKHLIAQKCRHSRGYRDRRTGAISGENACPGESAWRGAGLGT